jgi:hypothetical protein
MSVDIGGAMERGLDRVLSREGGILVGAFVAVGVVTDLVWETILGRFVRDYGTGDSFFSFVPPALGRELRQEWANYEVLIDLPVPVVSLLALLGLLWIGRYVLDIGAIRWFVGDASRDLEGTLFTRRVGWTVLNLIVGGLIYALAVGVGILLLVVPGIFLAVALYFYTYEVVVEGENAIEALANSYELTKGDRFELFLLGLLFTILGGVVGLVGVPTVLPGRLVPATVGAAATAAFGVYSLATAADVYRQLVTAEAAPAEPEGESTSDAPPDA